MKQISKINGSEARFICWLSKDEEALDAALVTEINYILKLNESELNFRLNDPFDYESFRDSKIEIVSTPIDAH